MFISIQLRVYFDSATRAVRCAGMTHNEMLPYPFRQQSSFQLSRSTE